MGLPRFHSAFFWNHPSIALALAFSGLAELPVMRMIIDHGQVNLEPALCRLKNRTRDVQIDLCSGLLEESVCFFAPTG